jgi:hypothetical protein
LSASSLSFKAVCLFFFDIMFIKEQTGYKVFD